MPRRSIPRRRVVPLVAVAWLAAGTAAMAQTGADRAMALYRERLRERETKRRGMIERIAALPALAAPPRPNPIPEPPPGRVEVWGRIMIGGEVFDANRGLTLEPILPGPETEADPVAEAEAPPQPVRRGLRAAGNMLAEENFDRWLFGPIETEGRRRGQLDRLLEKKVDQAASAHRLSPAQVDKLRLAGRGDIKRFFDAVEERRRSFDANRRDLKAGMKSLQDLTPLISDFEVGPFGTESIYRKTLAKTLHEGQIPRRPR